VSRNISYSFRRNCFFSAMLLVTAISLFAQSRPNPPAVAQNNIGTPRTYRAPDASLGAAARILALAGQVSVLRDDVPWALAVGDTITVQQVVITGPDGYAEFQVADGSHFEVFQNSRVIFRNNPGDWRDLLDVLIGKVKVQIEKLGGLPNPNKVRTPTAVISVRGTVFDVNVEDDDATTLVLVEEGQVEVRHLLRGGEGKLLNQGEWIRVFKNQAIATKVVDRGAVMQRAMRATMDAVYQAVLSNGPGRAGTPAGGGTSGGVGDRCPASNPNCTPPPPPPPPPH
jgi:ferric-dicitrate binding protein FerR (iron transport regulator)